MELQLLVAAALRGTAGLAPSSDVPQEIFSGIMSQQHFVYLVRYQLIYYPLVLQLSRLWLIYFLYVTFVSFWRKSFIFDASFDASLNMSQPCLVNFLLQSWNNPVYKGHSFGSEKLVFRTQSWPLVCTLFLSRHNFQAFSVDKIRK